MAQTKKKITRKVMAKKKPAHKAVSKAPVVKKATKPVRKSSGAANLQLLRGMKDIMPADALYWLYLTHKAESIAQFFGYGRIETPVLEMKDLFVRGIGADTDVVGKEMFCFVDQGGDEMCLRPEATASIARAYINHGLLNQPQPVRMYNIGPMFRHERPQAGRYREFNQVGFEALGDAHPVLDAEIISVAISFFRDIGLPVTVEINSIGCPHCRKGYREELVRFYKPKRELLCETCKERLVRNPLRLLDCKEEQCELLKRQAPQIVDWLDEPCRDHFFKVLEYLDEAEIAYTLNSSLVRGLDYYTRTVFEIKLAENSGAGEQKEHKAEAHDHEKDKDKKVSAEEKPAETISEPMPAVALALGGGGRYDGLVELLGGRPTPAVGFAIGMERIILEMKARRLVPPEMTRPSVFLAQLGETARRKMFALYLKLRETGVGTAASLSKDGLKPQLEIANRLGVKYSLIIGQKEVLDGTVIIRDMESGIQEVVDHRKVVHEIKKKLGLPNA